MGSNPTVSARTKQPRHHDLLTSGEYESWPAKFLGGCKRLHGGFRRDVTNGREPSDAQAAELVSYYEKSMSIFAQLGIDVNAKPDETQRLYHMMLLYLDNEEVICPAAARTASLMGFLETTDGGWTLPPTSQVVSPNLAAKEVDGYFAMEIFRNYRGLEHIRDELVKAINARGAQIHSA